MKRLDELAGEEHGSNYQNYVMWNHLFMYWYKVFLKEVGHFNSDIRKEKYINVTWMFYFKGLM